MCTYLYKKYVVGLLILAFYSALYIVGALLYLAQYKDIHKMVRKRKQYIWKLLFMRCMNSYGDIMLMTYLCILFFYNKSDQKGFMLNK